MTQAEKEQDNGKEKDKDREKEKEREQQRGVKRPIAPPAVPEPQQEVSWTVYRLCCRLVYVHIIQLQDYTQPSRAPSCSGP